MKLDKKDMLLYAVTDRSWLGGRTLAAQVEEALRGGATMIQLREKNLSKEEFLSEAFEIKELCRKFGVPFIINDDVDIAVKCGADGIHVGQHDMAAGMVRREIGTDMLLGVSAQTVEQALLAEKNGADYLGVGSVFTTSTKLDADSVTADTLNAICKAVSIPVVAIGGISADNILKLSGTGIDGVAVVSAVFAQKDIEKATKELRELSEKVVNS